MRGEQALKSLTAVNRRSLTVLVPLLLFLFLWTEKCCGQRNPPALQNITMLAIRLMSNSPNSNNRGRVELQVTDTVWGTICPAKWDSYASSNNANVTCYMLGFRNGGHRINNTFGPGSKNFVIENATCPINATSWYQCTQYFAKTCGPQDDEFAVECYPDSNGANLVQLAPVTSMQGSGGLPQVVPLVNPILLYGNSSATCTANPMVRLYAGDLIDKTVGNGYIQVSINGEWGFVCDETWNQAAAKVVCRELCFDNTDGFTPLPGIIAQSVPQPINRTIVLNGTSCRGNESSVLSCPVVNSSCPVESLLAGVQCRADCCKENPLMKPDVNCSSETLVANFSRFPLVTVNNVFLINSVPSQCMNLTSNLGYVMANVSVVSACGAVMQQNTTHITYTIGIRVVWLSAGTTINSYTNTRYDLVCSVPRIYTVTNRMEPYTQAPNITIYQQYNYSLSLDLFTNCNFTQMTESLESIYLVEVGQWLNVSVTIINYDNRTKLVITDCDAYPVMPYSAYTPVAKLIQDKCPVDNTLTMYSIDNRRQGFQVKAFMFLGYSMVYIRCSVNICLPNAVSSECSRTCTKPANGRRKREASGLQTVSLDTKSIYMYGPDEADFFRLLGAKRQSQQNVGQPLTDVVATTGNQGESDTKQQLEESTMQSNEQQSEQPISHTNEHANQSATAAGQEKVQSTERSGQASGSAASTEQPVAGTTNTVKQLSPELPGPEEKTKVSNEASAESRSSVTTTRGTPSTATVTTDHITETTTTRVTSTIPTTVTTTTVPVPKKTEIVTSTTPRPVTTTVPVPEKTEITTVQVTEKTENVTRTKPVTVATTTVQLTEITRESITSTRAPNVKTTFVQTTEKAREADGQQPEAAQTSDQQGKLTESGTEAGPPKNIAVKGHASEQKGNDPNRATTHHLSRAICIPVLVSILAWLLM